MSKFLFFTWNGGGNQPPEIGLAQELRDRGHEVTFAGYETQRLRFTELGFPFRLLERSVGLWRDEPPERRMAAVTRAVWACPEQAADVADAVDHEQCDALVIDCLMFGALAAAEQLKLPSAVLAHSGPGVLAPPGGPIDRLLLGPVNDMRPTLGRAPVSSLWEAWSKLPTLCVTLAELDPLSAQAPASFHYVGPIFERVPASGWRAPWPAGDPRPLVLVSFSTGRMWDQSSRIQRTLDALGSRPVRVVVTTGMADVAGHVPENAVLVPQVPHNEILKDASVTVTHAGHGTLAMSLAHGVPLVCLPNPGPDQQPLAAQVEALGAGRALAGDSASSEDIAAAVDEVLADQTYSATARKLGQAIRDSQPTSTAASLVEALR